MLCTLSSFRVCAQYVKWQVYPTTPKWSCKAPICVIPVSKFSPLGSTINHYRIIHYSLWEKWAERPWKWPWTLQPRYTSPINIKVLPALPTANFRTSAPKDSRWPSEHYNLKDVKVIYVEPVPPSPKFGLTNLVLVSGPESQLWKMCLFTAAIGTLRPVDEVKCKAASAIVTLTN